MEKNTNRYLIIILLTAISAFACNMWFLTHKNIWEIIDWLFFVTSGILSIFWFYSRKNTLRSIIYILIWFLFVVLFYHIMK